MLDSFEVFDEFIHFVNKLSLIAQSHSVEYESMGKKLVFLDQLSFQIFSEVLINHF